MRILGIDYGDRRIGLAVSDELGMTAQPLGVITRKNREHDLRVIRGYVEEWRVERVVVGYPVMLDGTEGVQCEKVSRFVGRLERYLPVPVELWDETLTTKEAEEVLVGAGIRREKRRTLVDKIAAALILQGYLDSHGCKAGVSGGGAVDEDNR